MRSIVASFGVLVLASLGRQDAEERRDAHLDLVRLRQELITEVGLVIERLRRVPPPCRERMPMGVLVEYARTQDLWTAEHVVILNAALQARSRILRPVGSAVDPARLRHLVADLSSARIELEARMERGAPDDWAPRAQPALRLVVGGR
jgi:hypothetical protein